jgi:hypothetical protein
VEQVAGPEDIHINGIEMEGNDGNLEKKASQGGC